MGLKCLLGHDFGEREVERDRREEGDEVVVVYRTVENCRRCGTRRIVSENKEVRSVRGAAAAESAATDADADAAERPEAGTNQPSSVGERADDGGTGGAGEAVGDPEPAPAGSLVEAAEAVGARDSDAESGGEDGTNGTDDAIILTGGEGEGDAGGNTAAEGESDGTAAEAEAEVEATAGSGAELLGTDASAGGKGPDGSDGAGGDWPTPGPDAEDEGFDAAPRADEDGATEADVDFGGGFAPTRDDPHAAYVGTDDEAEGSDFVRTEHQVATTDGPTEFRCPNCGSTQSARDSSLRAGDICPDCRKGYVAERAIEE